MHKSGPLTRTLPLTLNFILALCSLVPQAVAERGTNGREREEQIMRNAKAAEVLRYMNREADPCNNFYDFACGNWASHQPTLLEGDAPISVQSQLAQRVRKDVQMLLDGGARSKGRTNLDERKVKEFYKSCIVVERSSSLQQAFLMNFIKEYEGLPLLAGTNWNMNYDWVQVVARLRLNYGFDYLIGMEVVTTEHSLPGKAVIQLTEPATSLLPRHLCSGGAILDTRLVEKHTAQLQIEIALDLQSWFGLKEEETERVAGDIIRFELELCQYMRENESLPPTENDEPEPSVYEGRDLARLSKDFGNIINFRRYLETSLNSTVANSEIAMKSPAYFKNLARIARLNPRPTLTNYIMYRALAEINFPRNETSTPRAGYCAQLTMRFFPKVVGEIYKNRYQRSEIRTDAEQLFDKIKGTLSESLNVNDLSENAQRTLRNKLLAFERLLFPIYKGVNLRDLPLEHTNFWHKQDIAMKFKGYKERQRFYGGDPDLDESLVEAFDIRMQLLDNGIMTGWGLLQPPFYDYSYAKSLKYALLGPLIARELAAALIPDELETELTRDDSIMEIFDNVTECYRTQYSNYLYNIPNVFYNASKLRELMTDSAGLNIAFKAYLGWLADMVPTGNDRQTLLRETLPGVDFTNTQLFFIVFAQSRCHAKYVKEMPPTFLPLDTHTEELFNVNGVLGNNVEFAREFGCVLGTDMNPDDKCTMF
ncbi:PREDICTED: membrane metallo-endopeptidase-like 1 [Bactrocera latifrons]|uniref:Membrane metallo-endopeptidase-like 1 n=1 Tax=Bactrocera latifrons TaxID=174628 RepID=A0A0K8W4T3_BACLA|nr:PREDICTED: membrane metallo-endopeptidase-like 1 [Bactrocera latifrons]